ncbi:uncharacterized protein LOC123865559 [Maniola jurtina]|uniref:uncharacterized protein LOC123865559 n=1 Tax=Maniola jurtina TaxID=191418 RepID=UPI001E687B5D|nr:uncharacterized protein LOC123865559 [Maniola jurtina]
MGSMTIMLSIFAVFFIISYTEAVGNCPLASKVHGCTPKCQQTFNCSHGKQCCPNACHTKSCVDVAAYTGEHKHQTGGAGVYCANEKCSPFEVCKLDPATERLACTRA